MNHNNVQELFPLFYLERIACYCWGFVAGLYQTYELWEAIWTSYKNGGSRNVDFTKWQHDLIRPSLRPYDPNEIEIITQYSKRANDKYNSERK